MFKVQLYESIKGSELVVHFHTPNWYIGLGPKPNLTPEAVLLSSP